MIIILRLVKKLWIKVIIEISYTLEKYPFPFEEKKLIFLQQRSVFWQWWEVVMTSNWTFISV